MKQLALGGLAGFSLFLALGGLWPPAARASTPSEPPADSPCAYAAKSAYPHAYLTNGSVDVVVNLPDAERGSYRSSRFDWSGVIACAAYKGHTYFGPWSNNTDPMGNDTVTGPVEEFRGKQGEIGYSEAPAGGTFLKIGVGLLQRLDEKPYNFGTVYPILDHGRWAVKVEKQRITFTQTLRTPLGYAYRYQKTLLLASEQPKLSFQHTLQNLGRNSLQAAAYDHDFFVLDSQSVGPGFMVTFGFDPKADPPFPESLIFLDGRRLQFKDTPRPGLSAQGYLTGYNGSAGEYRFEVKDTRSGVGVLQTSTSPLDKVYFWSTARTICPEAYVDVSVAPGSTQRWQIDYTLEASPQ